MKGSQRTTLSKHRRGLSKEPGLKSIFRHLVTSSLSHNTFLNNFFSWIYKKSQRKHSLTAWKNISAQTKELLEILRKLGKRSVTSKKLSATNEQRLKETGKQSSKELRREQRDDRDLRLIVCCSLESQQKWSQWRMAVRKPCLTKGEVWNWTEDQRNRSDGEMDPRSGGGQQSESAAICEHAGGSAMFGFLIGDVGDPSKLLELRTQTTPSDLSGKHLTDNRVTVFLFFLFSFALF